MNGFPADDRGLLRLRKFLVPDRVLVDTVAFLKEVGGAGYEGFVVWGGILLDDATLQFRTAVIPEQRAYATGRGLLVAVEGDALFKVNKLLHERGEILAGQIHTHPTSAYHSPTDDHFPLVTLLGALSIVVPDFGQHAPADRNLWACYRLASYGVWRPAADDTEVIFE